MDAPLPHSVVTPQSTINAISECSLPVPTPPTPSLQNVVATFEMGKELDLAKLAMKCCFVQYIPKKFAAGVMRLREPRTTCLVFASGKAVCTGANTEQLACIAALKFVVLLQNSGIDDVTAAARPCDPCLRRCVSETSKYKT